MQSHIFATIRGSSVAFILFLLSTALMAQSGVKIKEHVTISPTQKPLLSTTSGGQFYITFQYSGELKEGTIIWRDIIINESEPCSTRYDDSSPLMTGQYKTRVDFYAATIGTATYQYFADGKLLKSITNTIDVVPTHVIGMKNFGFNRTFNFYKDSVVAAPGNMVEVEVYGTESVCEPNVGWSDSYSTTWSIVQGAEWGQFRDNYGNFELGKTCTRQPHEDGYIIHFQLVPDIPDSVSCIIIKAASDGVEKYKRIYLPPKELDHFKVTIVPDTASTADTVAFTEGAKLIVQAKDINDKDTYIDTNTLLNFSLLSNDDYGTFINANDTLKTTPVQLSNVTYGNANAGIIKFAAVKKNPSSFVSCKIRVAKQTDATKKGERDAIVVEQTLKIVMVQPYEVVPVIPPTTVNAPRNENLKQFTVQMTRAGQPVANHSFMLTTDYIDGSGGHTHITPRRTRSRDNYGHLILRRTPTHYDFPYAGQTQTNGKEEFDYVASIFGDTMKVFVKSREKTFLYDSANIVEKAIEMVNFRDIGQNCIFRQSDEGTLRHPDNNWCTQRMADSLREAINDLYEWSLTEEGGENPIILSLNDMSLRLGGRFDIDAQWDRMTNQHYYHRTGKSVDINNVPIFKVPDPNDNRRRILTRLGRRLENIMNRHGGAIYPEPQIHFDFQ